MKLENSIKPLIVYEEGDYFKIINFYIRRRLNLIIKTYLIIVR